MGPIGLNYNYIIYSNKVGLSMCRPVTDLRKLAYKGGRIVSLKNKPPFPQKIFGTLFLLEADSTPECLSV